MASTGPRAVFQGGAGRAKPGGGAQAAGGKQNDRHAQLATLLLKAELAPDPLERFLAVCRLVLAMATDHCRPGQGFTDVPVVMLGQHYLARRQLGEKHKGDAVQLFLQELSSHEPLGPTTHDKFSAPGATEVATVKLSVQPTCTVRQPKASRALLGGSSGAGEPYIECSMEGIGTVSLARHAEDYTFTLPSLLLLTPTEDVCQLDMGGACDIRCLATGLTGQLLFKQGHRIKGSVSRMGMAGALLETAAVAGTWDGQVTVESVDIEAAGILFDAGQLAPPLVPTITLGEPGPRLCPRLWSAILESLTVLADEGSQDKKAVGSKFLAVLPKKLRHSLLYEVERTGRPSKNREGGEGAGGTGTGPPLPPCVLEHRAKHGPHTYQLLYRLQTVPL